MVKLTENASVDLDRCVHGEALWPSLVPYEDRAVREWWSFSHIRRLSCNRLFLLAFSSFVNLSAYTAANRWKFTLHSINETVMFTIFTPTTQRQLFQLFTIRWRPWQPLLMLSSNTTTAQGSKTAPQAVMGKVKIAIRLPVNRYFYFNRIDDYSIQTSRDSIAS